MKTEINRQQFDYEQLAEELVAEYSDSGMGGDENVIFRVAPHLWRELATTGQPVDPERLATLAGIPRDQVVAALRDAGAEWDPSGEHVVGQGVSLLSTPHRYDTDGRTVWTWCAPDLLELPVVLGEPATVQSPCPVTGDLVRVEVTPTSVEDVEPAGAVISIVMSAPDSPGAVRTALCNQQNFYRDADVAAGWQAANPTGLVLPIADAFEVLRRLFQRVLPAEFLS